MHLEMALFFLQRQKTGTMSDEIEDAELDWQEEDEEVEELGLPEGLNWTSLSHKGPIFPPDYQPLPDHVR